MRCSPINPEATGGFLIVKIDEIQCMFCVYCPRIEHEKKINPSASQQKHGVEKRGPPPNLSSQSRETVNT